MRDAFSCGVGKLHIRTKLKGQYGIVLWVLCGFRLNFVKVVLVCFDGIFRGFFVRYFDKCYLRVSHAGIYNTNACIYLEVFLVKMAVAHVVYIDDLAKFYCMVCA